MNIDFLLSCWGASVIVTFILTHKFTSRVYETEIKELRALNDKLHVALMAKIIVDTPLKVKVSKK